jgi:hypothetical protein
VREPDQPERDEQFGRAVLDSVRYSWAARVRSVIVVLVNSEPLARGGGLRFSS